MTLLLVSIGIALMVIILGMVIVGGAGMHINMDRLQVFIAVASGYMLAALFLDLLPENIGSYPNGAKSFFAWSLLGMLLVIVSERYVLPRIRFVEQFFHSQDEGLAHIHTHDESLHSGSEHSHHDHHDLKDARDCEQSHEHAHIHQHTHGEILGHGEVCSAIACFMICSFFDGIALSSVQAVDQKLGILMVIAVILHLLPEGILSGAMVLAGGATVKSAQKVIIFIGGAFVLGALVPKIIQGQEPTFLAVASGIITFVTLVQLLPTALRLKFAPIWIATGIGLFLLSHALIERVG